MRNQYTLIFIFCDFWSRFSTVSAETDIPLGGTAVLFWCGNTDIPQLPHIYWDPPIPHSVSQLDMAMLCVAKKNDNNNNNTSTIRQNKQHMIYKYFFFTLCNGAPVFVLVRAPPSVFAVMVVWTGITLTAQTRWFLTEFCLVVGQYVVVI